MSRESTKPSPLLFFIHIPKTAGSSIHQILHREYGKRLGIFYDLTPREWEMTLARPDHGFDCIFGHYWFGPHARSARPYEYATLMRHPVEAILSYYFYIAHHPSHWLNPFVLQMPMKDFFSASGQHYGCLFPELSVQLHAGPPSRLVGGYN